MPISCRLFRVIPFPLWATCLWLQFTIASVVLPVFGRTLTWTWLITWFTNSVFGFSRLRQFIFCVNDYCRIILNITELGFPDVPNSKVALTHQCVGFLFFFFQVFVANRTNAATLFIFNHLDVICPMLEIKVSSINVLSLAHWMCSSGNILLLNTEM